MDVEIVANFAVLWIAHKALPKLFALSHAGKPLKITLIDADDGCKIAI